VIGKNAGDKHRKNAIEKRSDYPENSRIEAFLPFKENP
jgi:hypothetical protein